MIRRLEIEEPPSRLAHGAWWLALFALAVMVVAFLLTRADIIEALPGAVAVSASLALAALAVLLALAAFAVIWVNGNPGFGRAFWGLVIGGLLIAYPVWIAVQAYGSVPLGDVTTSIEDPPAFVVIARLRPPAASPVAYAGAEAAKRQREAYPEISPLAVAATPEEAYAAALAVVSRRRWTIVDARAVQAGRREGRIEAVARSPVMGFRDDVVLRVRPQGVGAVVDIRSASRYAFLDLGNNAARVRSLAEEIEEELSSQPAAR